MNFLICLSCACLLWMGAPLNQATDVHIALIYDIYRPDILKTAYLAIDNFNQDLSSSLGHRLVGHNFPVSNYNRFAVIQQFCAEKDNTSYAGIVDITTDGGGCGSLQLAYQMDAAFMSILDKRCYSTPTYSVRFNNMAYFNGLSRIVMGKNASRQAVAMFYDYTFDIGPILPMQNIPWFVPTYLFEIPGNESATRQLLTTAKKETDATEFVVLSSVQNASVLLQQAAALNISKGIYHWYVFTRDNEEFTCNANCMGNDVIHIQHKIWNSSLLTSIKNTVTVDVFNTLKQKSLDLYFAYEAVFTLGQVVAPLVNEDAWNNATSTFICYVPRDPQLTFFAAYDDALKMYSADHAGVVAQVEFVNKTVSDNVAFMIERCRLGVCTDTKNLYWSGNDSLSAGNVDMTYQTIPEYIILIMEDPPFLYKNFNGTLYSGYCIDVLNYLAGKMNFTYILKEPDDHSYGMRLDNGTWTGIIGEMANGYADMALGPITITAERETVVDFSIPYYDYAGLQIVIGPQDDGSGGSGNMFYFLTVFEGWVWLCIGITLVLTGVLVTVFDRLSPYSFQNKTVIKEGEPEGKIFTFKESMWFVLGAYTQAGESFDPRATSTRMLVAGFWLFSCIMMAMYTANLAAFLTVSKLTTSIQSVEDLAAQTDTKYSVQANTAGQVYFQRMRDIEANFYNIWKNISVGDEYTVSDVAKYSVWEYPIQERYTDMYNRMEKWGFSNSTADSMDKVKNQNWAIFMETPFIKYYQSKDCNLLNTGEILGSRPYGIVLQNKSPLTSQVNMLLLQMQSDRVLENLKVDWWSKEKVDCPVVESNTGIKIETLGGVFIFLAGGIVLGGIVLIIEIIVAKVFGVQRFMPDEENLKCNQPKPILPGHHFSSSVSVRLHSPRPIAPRGSLVPSRKNSEIAVISDNTGHLVAPGGVINRGLEVDKM